MGNVAVVGAGPGGLAAAIALAQAGHAVDLFEKGPDIRSSGNGLSMWPPPLKVLMALGVDTGDLGYPCDVTFRRADGHLRVRVRVPDDIKREYGGFVGLLRTELSDRMVAALPPTVTVRTGHGLSCLTDHGDGVTLTFADRRTYEADLVVGADGVHSAVRKNLWGDAPLRLHGLHAIGGFTFAEIRGAEHGGCTLTFSKDKQGSWSSIRHRGEAGFMWWINSPWKPGAPFAGDLKAVPLAQARAEFNFPLPQIIAATCAEDIARWEIRDRPPLRRWSKGRVTLIGDAAHPTSPYAAYGAGMAIEDAYFLARAIAALDIADTEAVTAGLAEYEHPRREYTRQMAGIAYMNGKLFHHVPPVLRDIRDWIFDHTSLLQRQAGDNQVSAIYRLLGAIDGPIKPGQ